MDRSELIDFLRENLTLNVSTSREYDFNNESVEVRVSLGILDENGEVENILEDWDSFDVNN